MKNSSTLHSITDSIIRTRDHFQSEREASLKWGQGGAVCCGISTTMLFFTKSTQLAFHERFSTQNSDHKKSLAEAT